MIGLGDVVLLCGGWFTVLGAVCTGDRIIMGLTATGLLALGWVVG